MPASSSSPHVASYHTHFDRYLEYYKMRRILPLYWKYMKWYHRSCDAVLAPSRETLTSLRMEGFTRLRLWSRGVDCTLYSPERRSEETRERYGKGAALMMLYVGRIAPEKKILPPSFRLCSSCRSPYVQRFSW
ncbi:glycosyltransferase [Paenibacillus rhizoplanae]